MADSGTHEPTNQGNIIHKLSKHRPENKDVSGFQDHPCNEFPMRSSITFYPFYSIIGRFKSR